MLNDSTQGDLGTWPQFLPDDIELWINGSEPTFHNWNTLKNAPLSVSHPSTGTTVSSPQLHAMIVFFLLGLAGSWILL
jgi:hypothetical protein